MFRHIRHNQSSSLTLIHTEPKEQWLRIYKSL